MCVHVCIHVCGGKEGQVVCWLHRASQSAREANRAKLGVSLALLPFFVLSSILGNEDQLLTTAMKCKACMYSISCCLIKFIGNIHVHVAVLQLVMHKRLLSVSPERKVLF